MRVHDRLHGDFRRSRCPSRARDRCPARPLSPSTVDPQLPAGRTCRPCDRLRCRVPRRRAGRDRDGIRGEGPARHRPRDRPWPAAPAWRSISTADRSGARCARARHGGPHAAGPRGGRQPARPHLAGRPGDLRHRGRSCGGRVVHRRRLAPPRPHRPAPDRDGLGGHRGAGRLPGPHRPRGRRRAASHQHAPESRPRGAIRPPNTGGRVLS